MSFQEQSPEHHRRSPLEERLFSAAQIARSAGAIATGNTVSIGETVVEKRDYQAESWQALDAARAAGKDTALLHLATGLGKTTIAVVDALRFADEFMAYHGKMPNILFAVHQTEILDQAAERFKQFAPELKQGSYMNREKNLNTPLTLGTMQSLYANLHTIDAQQFDYIIYDEAHHAKAETFNEVVDHFKPAFQLAITATPERMDEERIEELFGEPVYSKTLAEAMTEGYLADVDYHIVFDEAVRQAMEHDFNPTTLKEIRDLLSNESRNEEIALQIMEEMEKIGLKDAKTLVFCENIEQANEMGDLLDGRAYHSGIPKEDRQDIMHQFRSNGLQIITSRDMFNEGVDIPDARLIVFLRSTSSRTVFEQQLGRGLRKNKDKDSVTVLDFVANIERLELVKELVNKVAPNPAIITDGGPQNPDETPPVDLKPGIRITNHGEFDFDKLSIQLLDKLAVIRDDGPFTEMTNEELIEYALTLSPEKPLTDVALRELAKSGQFMGTSAIIGRFGGSLSNFHRACGFEVADRETIHELSDQELIELANQLSPDTPLPRDSIATLSKEGGFASRSQIESRFGSLANFHKACGHTVVTREDRNKLREMSNDELIEIARMLSPSKPLSASEINKLSGQGIFVSDQQIYKRFGSLSNFQNACEATEGVVPQSRNQQLINKALEIQPSKPLTTKDIAELSKNKEFPSAPTIAKLFGSLADFHRACGFEVKERISTLSKADPKEIIRIANEISPNKPLTQAQINKLSKDKRFPSAGIIRQHFGSITAFQDACNDTNNE